jgi:hypothetical protein
MRGGAAEACTANNVLGLSEPADLFERLDPPEGIEGYEGRLNSGPVVLELALVGELVLEDATATAEAKGAAKVFFTREKRDVTSV